MAKKKKPEIRFKGFTDVWKQHKLLDCISKITDFRGRTPKKLGMDWSESGYLALSALNVKDGYIDFTQDVHYGSQALYDKWMTGNELHIGQVLFTTEAPMGNVAQVPDNKRYILSQRTIAFDAKDELITENFLATILRTPTTFSSLTALSSGGTAKGISQKSLATVDIIISTKLDEQERLADFFSELDNIIALHQCKYEKLQNIKKSMLEKMFPKLGSNIPEIRFRGFADVWKQCKLGEITSLITKGTTPIDKLNNGSINFIKIENINNFTGEIFPTAKISIQEHERYLKRSQLQENDILFSIAGTLGRVSVINKNILPANTNQALAIIRLKSGYLNYITTYLKGKAISEYIKKNPTIGAQPNLSLEQVANLEIIHPIDEEQKQIGIFFKHIDNLITLHQHKYKKLQNIKKAMLEKMFV